MGKEWSFDADSGDTLFIYIFWGRAESGKAEAAGGRRAGIDAKEAVLFGRGDTFRVRALEEDVRFILLSAKPLNEPIAWGGPIVMNTSEELQLAFRELDTDQFIKKR